MFESFACVGFGGIDRFFGDIEYLCGLCDFVFLEGAQRDHGALAGRQFCDGCVNQVKPLLLSDAVFGRDVRTGRLFGLCERRDRKTSTFAAQPVDGFVSAHDGQPRSPSFDDDPTVALGLIMPCTPCTKQRFLEDIVDRSHRSDACDLTAKCRQMGFDLSAKGSLVRGYSAACGDWFGGGLFLHR